MSKFRIAHILAPVEFGGAEKVSLTFFRHVNRNRIDSYPILLIRPWEEDGLVVKELQREGYSFVRIPVAKRPSSQGRDYLRLLRCFKLIYKELKTGQFDLVHTQGYFADIIGLVAAKKLHIPIVSTCHGFISNDWKFRLYNQLDFLALRFMNQVITVSEQIKSDLVAKGIKETKIKIIQNAVEVKDKTQEVETQRHQVRLQYGLREDGTVLGYVGRLSIEKGLTYLIKAGERLAQAGVPFYIFVIGDGPQEEEIQQIVTEYGLEEKIIFVGFQKDVSALLPAFDIFLLPSLTEGTSMALLEAMACGLPVIATAVGGTPNVIISEENGILVPSKSPEAIVQAVIRLVENKELCQRMGHAALQTIESEYSLHSWLKKIDDIYTVVIQSKR
ncbi:Glycosyltransferase involved in cell wall bisynthesis [Candidatus Electrothrix marina]|uniref:Glycosyltransferase involved in cell wall bisynthesis n=2 Tax=Candidatus Electrothrix marina TaxID=1859130 RepID=A0A444JDE2_9BACT|nr:Glycosyltransferase involved in cell wall bisynthesis [Candidatus Electrothrix marina]